MVKMGIGSEGVIIAELCEEHNHMAHMQVCEIQPLCSNLCHQAPALQPHDSVAPTDWLVRQLNSQVLGTKYERTMQA